MPALPLPKEGTQLPRAGTAGAHTPNGHLSPAPVPTKQQGLVLLKGCLWRILVSVVSQKCQLRPRAAAEEGQGATDNMAPSGSGPLEAGAPTDPAQKKSLLKKSQIQDSSAPQPACCGTTMESNLQSGICCLHHLAYQINS